MSGYHPDTDIFELTGTKADFWFRRKLPPKDFKSLNGFRSMGFYADLFIYSGFDVVKVENSYLYVKATPEQVWEVLSGQPSDPKRAEHYYRNPAPGDVKRQYTNQPGSG